MINNNMDNKVLPSIQFIKYIKLCNDNYLKDKSLEDNVYFTLRDIFINISGSDYCMEANEFNSKLTNNIYYDGRTSDFKYTDILNDKTYLSKLTKWLLSISQSDFDFEPLNDNSYAVLLFEDWWIQFERLKELLNNI